MNYLYWIVGGLTVSLIITVMLMQAGYRFRRKQKDKEDPTKHTGA